MATYVPPKRATAWRGYISVVSQANTKIMQANPTIAAGDFKVSKDGGALANLATLPSVAPASSKMIQIDLDATEMTADNVTIVGSDAAGSEWCDIVINLQTAARQVDDLCYPTTSGRSLDVTATGAAGMDWGNVENPTTAVDLSGTTIKTTQVVASVTGAVGSVTGAVGSVTGNVGGNVTGSVGSLAAQAKTDVNAEVVDALNTDTYAEPGQEAPGATVSLVKKIGYLYKAWRNKTTQTATAYNLFADDASTVDQKATVSDDATTFTKTEIASGP